MKTFYSLLLSLLIIGVAQAQEKIPAKKGGIVLHPVVHATMILEWNGKTIYVDPYGGAEKFEGKPKADLILITDIHGDHLNIKTLEALDLSGAEFIVPSAVKEKMGDLASKAKKVWELANGESTEWDKIKVEAVPMYNLPETDDSRHPKGRGNGYIVTMGGKRLYISGDTEDIDEMRKLKKIDVAFICMNLPYTMEEKQAASAVAEFQPKVVYPFHYRGGGGKFSDVEAFKKMVEEGSRNVEVKLLDWYAK